MLQQCDVRVQDRVPFINHLQTAKSRCRYLNDCLFSQSPEFPPIFSLVPQLPSRKRAISDAFSLADRRFDEIFLARLTVGYI